MKISQIATCLCLLVIEVDCESECPTVCPSQTACATHTVCPNGWTRYDDSCYLFGHGDGMAFVEAEHFCKQHHAEIVQIESTDENLFIKDYLLRLTVTRYWLGLTDEMIETAWRWYETDKRADYFDWGPAEPNGQVDRGDEDCVVYLHWPYQYQWADVPCLEKNHPICEIRMSKAAEPIVG